MDTDESSKQILTFMEKNFKNLYGKMPDHFSEKSKNALYPILRLMIEAKQMYHKYKSQIEYIIPTDSELEKKQLYQYIPNEIKTIIEKMNHPHKVMFKVHQRNITVFFYNNHHIHSQYIEYIENIYIWLYVAYRFSFGECSQNLEIFIYLTDETKHLPRTKSSSKTPVIDEINANTGLTTGCKPINEIHVYRKEEWFKVFIHETFHNLGMEFSEMDINSACKKLFSHFPIKKNILFYETYCEVWSEIIYALFLSFADTKEKDADKIIDNSKKYISIMQLFSIIQCVKVLRHNKLHYVNLYDYKPSMEQKHRNYIEKTEVLAYYVFKSVLLFHLNDFIEWCSLHNGKKVIQFSKSQLNISQYCDLIIFTYKFHNDTYVTIYDIINNWFENHKKTNKYEYITLRMTPF